MKYILLTPFLLGISILSANQIHFDTHSQETMTAAIKQVEAARKNVLTSLHQIIETVEQSRLGHNSSNEDIATQIIETYALSEIAKSTANVEITKAHSTSLITQAIDSLDPKSLSIIANAVSSVEVAKAKAKANIIKVTGKVELSKTKNTPALKHPQETLTIAKNLAAIQIAQAVSRTEMEKSISRVEIARSSALADPENTHIPLEKSQKKLEDLKAKATANISSYLANIEVTKANMLAKIAEEIAKVEITKLQTPNNSNTTYPNRLLQVKD